MVLLHYQTKTMQKEKAKVQMCEALLLVRIQILVLWSVEFVITLEFHPYFSTVVKYQIYETN